MIDEGDVYVADLNDEQRRRVLVVSTARFNNMSGRAIVAPAMPGPPDAVPLPWRIEFERTVFAVDFVRSVPVARLLGRTARVDSATLATVRRAIRNIT